MNGENVWMIERRSSFRFLNEAVHALLLRRHFSRQNFQRYFAIEGSTQPRTLRFE